MDVQIQNRWIGNRVKRVPRNYELDYPKVDNDWPIDSFNYTYRWYRV
jgi:hypothetical protein